MNEKNLEISQATYKFIYCNLKSNLFSMNSWNFNVSINALLFLLKAYLFVELMDFSFQSNLQAILKEKILFNHWGFNFIVQDLIHFVLKELTFIHFAKEILFLLKFFEFGYVS